MEEVKFALKQANRHEQSLEEDLEGLTAEFARYRAKAEAKTQALDAEAREALGAMQQRSDALVRQQVCLVTVECNTPGLRH